VVTDKKSLTEADICRLYITPQVIRAGWHEQYHIREQYTFTAGRVMVRGKQVQRGERKRADYVLFVQPNLPIAIIEAKDNNHSVGAGLQQALAYAEALDIPFVYSSNGDGFIEHDRTATNSTVIRELTLAQFPSPSELWQRYQTFKGLTAPQTAVSTTPYYDGGKDKSPRYYQRIAINRTVEAIAQGRQRLLLVMATGTGKTYTAFQIIWRLWKSGAKKRILFLVDRNILADQTRINDFKPFGNALTKITNRTIDKSYEIYISLYQAITGNEESQNIYRHFSPDFFDLVIVDECHRGSAADDAAWRTVLEYFRYATQIGLTATPKETATVSNTDYFGEPIYTYSLKQGIDDGFLAPYKVIRVGLDKDLEGWRPEQGKLDVFGNPVEDREYNSRDYDRNLILDQRTKTVADKISDHLKRTNRFDKTIVFCENIDHAERMRQALVNANPDLAAADARYVMRITGDNDEGKAQLDNFIDPESAYPVIAVTSQLMSTGVDAQTCKVIVLDKIINSMTEFKQIIGRGTRINETYQKYYFTIIDFRQATKMFADPDFDGDPIPDENFDPTSGGVGPGERTGGDGGGSGITYRVNDVPVRVINEQVQYLDATGKLITTSLTSYSRNQVQARYQTLDAFLTEWNKADRKKEIINTLQEQGVFFDELAQQVGREYDVFDLICHVAFDAPPLTRRERADNVRKRHVFAKYAPQARAVLDALLDKYAETGILDVEDPAMLRINPFALFGTPLEIARLFGGNHQYLAAIHELQGALYQKAA
jgi:type I restriction enzyme, R subunit